MKNILIVTDFTEASKNAGRYAVELAGQLNAGLLLFHVYQAPLQIPESYILYTAEDVWGNAKDLLEKEAAEINENKKVSIEICGAEGSTVNTIITEATHRNVDLIVCAMKGNAKGIRKIFGSTTSALAAKTDIPLLVIPENAVYRPIKNMALASDFNPENESINFEVLKALGASFNSGLSVVWVVDEGFNPEYEMRFRPAGFINQLKSMNPVFEFPTGENVIKALDGFIKEHTVDLLAMIPYKHDFLEKIFTESFTKKMIFHTDIPLLLLPQKSDENPADHNDPKKLNESV